MEANDFAIIIGAFLTGFAGLLAAVFKGLVPLIKVVSHKVDESKNINSEELEDLKKVVRLEMAKVHNEVSMITAKLAWTESAPEKTKKIMDSAIEKLKDMHKSQQEWLTSEIVRVIETKKGDKK